MALTESQELGKQCKKSQTNPLMPDLQHRNQFSASHISCWFFFSQVLYILKMRNQSLSEKFLDSRTYLFLHVIPKWVILSICFYFISTPHVVEGNFSKFQHDKWRCHRCGQYETNLLFLIYMDNLFHLQLRRVGEIKANLLHHSLGETNSFVNFEKSVSELWFKFS